LAPTLTVVRWSRPALVLAGALLWVDALAGGDLAGSTPALVVIAGLAVVAGLHSRPLSLFVACTASALLLAVADQVGSPGQFAAASDGVFYAVVVFAPGLVGWLVGERNRQVTDLTRQRQGIQARRLVGTQLANLREQEFIARRIDLALTGRFREIIAGAEGVAAARAGSRDAQVRDGLDSLETGAREALKELRELLENLRDVTPATSDPPEPVMAASPRRADAVDVFLVLAAVPLAVETALPGHRGAPWLNVLVSLGQGVLLPLVRRRPIPGVVVLLAVAALQTAFLAPIPPTVSWLLPGLLAAFLVGLAPTQSTAVIGLAVTLAGVCGVTLATPSGHRSLSGLVPSLVVGTLSWVGGRIVAARDRRAGELRAIAAEMARSADQEEKLAVVARRAEISRELHDVGAHALTVVCLHAGAAQAWWTRDPDRALGALDTVVNYTQQTLTRLSSSLGQLATEDEAEVPTPADLETLVETSRALGMHVNITVQGLNDTRDDVTRVAYRIVQEALTNAARHAGRTTVDVTIAVVGDLLEVRVVDRGRDPHAVTPVPASRGAGLGLHGMRERVTALRGELTAGPKGNGFEVMARLPK
jgi:signal transduction histidine kinase